MLLTHECDQICLCLHLKLIVKTVQPAIKMFFQFFFPTREIIAMKPDRQDAVQGPEGRQERSENSTMDSTVDSTVMGNPAVMEVMKGKKKGDR